MLVLTRKKDDAVLLTLPDGRAIVVKVIQAGPERVKLGFDAPADVRIMRRELDQAEPQNLPPITTEGAD